MLRTELISIDTHLILGLKIQLFNFALVATRRPSCQELC